MKQKTKDKAKPLFEYLLQLGRREPLPLPQDRSVFSKDGVSAIEWFVFNESNGDDLPTRHPITVDRIKTGRSIKGLTKNMWIEDLRNGLIRKFEVFEWAFSEEDAQDVINRASC